MAHRGHAEVTISDGCEHGGKKGFILHSQEFPAQPGVRWYWIILPEIHPIVGYWYNKGCLKVSDGELPVPDKETIKRCRIEKDGNVAYFDIDKSTVNLMRSEGYIVTSDKLKK